MHVHLNDKEHLFALLAEGAALITPNNRLSESLISDYFAYRNRETVDKPKCFPYGVALTLAYEQLYFKDSETEHPTLLNTFQCEHLWQKIIKSHPNITYSTGLLQSVIRAWENCQQWYISPEDQTFHYTAQTQQFQRWWQHFNQKLAQNHWITQSQLVPYLIQANSRLFNQPVIWACFDDFTPQQHQLQQHMQEHGLQQYHYDLKEQAAQIELFAANDDKEEYQQLIAWLQAQIEQKKQRIAVVVPDLQQKSQTMQRILAQHLDPALFNISLGQALIEFPLVAHALCWLKLDSQFLNPHQASLLLQSPYLGDAQQEFLARSEYLQNGVLLENRSISFKAFIHDLALSVPSLAELLSQIKIYPEKASIHDWIDLFQERLNLLGFPGDYGLNSGNYQCLNRFYLLFDELRQLTLLTKQLTQSEALAAIQQLTENTIFQAQKIHAPIQISGMLEASGCEFDSVWVMGLTDQCLPKKVQLSAFIPPQLQRDLQMPYSLPARELQFAQQILQRFQKSAGAVVFSYPQLLGDNPNLPCSLITQIPPFHAVPVQREIELNPNLLSIEENYTIPLSAEEPISGGTALLANQAKCPFKAFAEHRLRAKTSNPSTEGLDNKKRGQIIHKVMELLWQQLGNQQELLNLDTHHLEHLLDQVIQNTLTSMTQEQHQSISLPVKEVEIRRLKRLALDCLEWEKKRPPFTVAGLEQSYTINLAGLELHVRVDRLDHVANKKWVIDYKSSLPAHKPWNEERPKEPQLLLYALLDPHINALLLMQLKTGRISCSGFSEEKQSISGISSLKKEERWEEYRTNWQEQLTGLAQEFQEGLCVPQPAQASICQYCDYQNLCRFQEMD